MGILFPVLPLTGWWGDYIFLFRKKMEVELTAEHIAKIINLGFQMARYTYGFITYDEFAKYIIDLRSFLSGDDLTEIGKYLKGIFENDTKEFSRRDN